MKNKQNMAETCKNLSTLWKDQIFGLQAQKKEKNFRSKAQTSSSTGSERKTSPKKGRHVRSQQHHRQEQKRNSPQHIIVKTLNIQNKEKVLKATREKSQVTYESKPTRITADFSVETLKAKRA